MHHIRTALLKLAAAEPAVRRVVVPITRQADKWQSLPKGWDDASRKKFWETLTGDNKHKVTKCIKEMSKPGKDIDDPGAFCAALADRVLGKDWRSKKAQKTWTLDEGMEMFDQWYKSTGHWVYSTREKALKTWQTRGIENLPDYKRLKRAAQEQTPNAVDGAAARFKDHLEVKLNEQWRLAHPEQIPPTLTLLHGNDLIRVIKADGGLKREAVAFIARATGNVYLAATWDRPLPHVIANVLQTDTWRSMRMAFDQYNVPELLGQLKKLLLEKGLDETWDEIQKCQVPRKVNDAWMSLSPKERRKRASRLAELRAQRQNR